MGASASSSRLFMGFPVRSPISDLFQGTIYITLGCSRSPVTVAVLKSTRSAVPGAFWPAAWGARLAAAVRGGAGVPAGAGAPRAAALAPDDPGDVSARGSPASICAVDFVGPRIEPLGAGVAGTEGGDGATGAVSCAAAAPPAKPAAADQTKSQLKGFMPKFMKLPSSQPGPRHRRVYAIPPPNRRPACFHRQFECSARTARALFAARRDTNRTERLDSDRQARNLVQWLSYAGKPLRPL